MKYHLRLLFQCISILAVLALLAGVLPQSSAFAASSPAAITNPALTFFANADAYVNQSTANSNYGSNISLRIDNSPITRSYLRFEVSGLNGAAVQSVRLRVYANSANSAGYTVSTVSDNSWDEAKVTYANAPAVGSALATSAPFLANQWTEADVTSLISGDGVYSLVLSSEKSTSTNLASKESANAPQLVVTLADQATAAPTNPPAPTQTAVPTQAPTAAPTLTSVPTQAPTAAPTSAADGQPSFPIRAAFYYPWFPQAWTQKGITPYTNYTPKLGTYSSTDAAVIRQHIDMMNYGGIQAGIASWWGVGHHTDQAIPTLLSSAAGTQFRWGLYYENESQGDPSVSQIKADLTYIRDHYGKDPSYLRVNGKFVVFVYADANDACGMADRWKQANTVNAYIVLKVFPLYRNCASQPDSWHQYSPAVASDKQGSESFAISPGFWLKGQSVRLARDLNRWTQNVKDMVASGAKWQLVTTFNEWGEGTSVEPAAEWASPSGYGQYLDVLHNNGSGTAPQPTTAPTQAPTTAPTVAPTTQPTAGPTATQPASGASNVLLVAGDVCKHNLNSSDYTANCKKTGDLIRSLLASNPGATVQTLGDNVNNDGSVSYDSEYTDLYAPNWGSFLNVTRSVMGNHDTYPPSGTAPYFAYFGAQAGAAPGGYYSYNIGANWHIIALNAQCSKAGGCAVGTPQYNWLKSDLEANTRKCVMAVWHQPRFTSGRHSDDATSADWWNLLYQYKADIVANGHNHNYERFNLINPQQQAAADGIREFIVGTGGAPGDGYSYSAHPLDPNEAVRNQSAVYGVLKLTLNDSSYTWNYQPVPGYSFSDSGTTACH